MTASTLPRLLAPYADAPVVSRGAGLIEAVAAAGLRGRGGAAFPTAVKLRAVAAAGGRRALVVNGAEGEPMSVKDRVLLQTAPQLVLDGAALAAEAVGAREVVIAVKHSASSAQASLQRALAARRDAKRMSVRTVPDGYVAGEETALLHSLNGGPAKPSLALRRPYERGLARRPTLVGNVETLAHMALIARYGANWFRELGTAEHPGSALVTLSGAVARPGVYEIALGTSAADVIESAGGRSAPVRALLVGGYYGAWVPAGAIASLRLDDGSLRDWDAALGAGAVVALSADACPVAVVARVIRWMAGESAGQCGPCVHGLDAIAGALDSLAAGTADAHVLARLQRWCGQVTGRGACRHPDGVVRFLRSALDVFAGEFDDHRRYGPCDACDRRPVLAVPGSRRRVAA
jgi:NADH:ubiquinone oxidoreductase subunit F (NADH-binding)